MERSDTRCQGVFFAAHFLKLKGKPVTEESPFVILKRTIMQSSISNKSLLIFTTCLFAAVIAALTFA